MQKEDWLFRASVIWLLVLAGTMVCLIVVF